MLKNKLITLIQAFNEIERASMKSDDHILSDYLNKKVFIRTATHYHLGVCTRIKDGFIALSKASWVADTGRFNLFLKTGELKECELFQKPIFVGIGAIIDITEFDHELPSESK